MQKESPPYRLPEGLRIYAIGDVHGMADLLAQRQADIDADLARQPVAAALEIYLGDLVDRGPESRRVLKLVRDRARQRPTICLLGNHEHYMLKALWDPAIFEFWVRSAGGDQTLAAFGIKPPGEGQFARALAEWRAALAPEEVAFLSGLKVWHREGDYLFVHAGIRAGVTLEEQSLDDLTSIRRPFLDATGPFGCRVVHGHTPVSAVDIRPHRINVDTGAVFSGLLSCVVIEDRSVRIL